MWALAPTNVIGPTQGQRKSLTRVGIKPASLELDHRCSTDWATRSDRSRSWEFKMSIEITVMNMYKYKEGLCFWKRWLCSTNISTELNYWRVTWSAIFYPCKHVSTSPTNGIGPTQERWWSDPKVVGSIPTLVRVFLCPCVGPIPLVRLTFSWFTWGLGRK